MSGEKRKIIIVDDSDIIRHSLKSFFEQYDVEVITCTNGLEGIQKSLECNPDLILLDIMMPGLDGLKMLKVIKMLDNLKDVPVVVISAHTDRNNIIEAVNAGADKVISKPVTKELLIKTTKELLGDKLFSESKARLLSSDDANEIKKQLLKFFVHGFAVKKEAIFDSLESENAGLLKTIMHELKGTGGAIGYPEISEISGEVEQIMSEKNPDWAYIRSRCTRIFSIIREIKI